jgi:PPK2 family polyphosphate:nucleotide phosphotransferase
MARRARVTYLVDGWGRYCGRFVRPAIKLVLRAHMDTARFRVRPGQHVNLRKYDPADTGPFKNKHKAAGKLEKGLERLVTLQQQLYARDRWSLLLIFQAMDAAGKDSAIKHVMSGLNPQGTQVYSFKRPSEEDLDHDYLWRAVKALPERGRIGIFNRSYYEEVLVVRVHPEILARQRLPQPLVTRRIWNERYEDINALEQHLARNGTVIRKFFLHLSRQEQRRRLMERLDDPLKNWKFEPSDLDERARWSDYMRAYEQALSRTSTRHAPWYIIPADHKWFTRLAIAEVVVGALQSLDLGLPKLAADQLEALAAARKRLEAEP